MKVFIALLFVGLAAAVPTGDKFAKRFTIYGAPVPSGEIPAMDGLRIAEKDSWQSVYDKPLILAVKKADKPELATFLVESGLAGLARNPETRALHDLLAHGSEKAGVLMSGAKALSCSIALCVDAPEIELPISSLELPKDYTLSRLARLGAGSSFPTLYIAPKESLKASALAKLSLVGDFTVTEDSIKVQGHTQA